MKGLEISERFFYEVGLPRLKQSFSEEMAHMAFGLAGEGSDCFGFDDEISRDHDWGAGFCIWLTEEGWAHCGQALTQLYRTLPTDGFPCRQDSPQGILRVGPVRSRVFYQRYIGRDTPPETSLDWLRIPEENLALVTNGAVFLDCNGTFTAMRKALLAHYPVDVLRKKLAAKAAKAARAGQYQYPRCRRRCDDVAAALALADFMNEAMGMAYLLNGRYMPYFKWRFQGLKRLPVFGGSTAPLFASLAQGGTAEKQQDAIEEICGQIADELRRRGLSACTSDFLQDHIPDLFSPIEDPVLKRMNVLEG